jgi:hypothetical protein
MSRTSASLVNILSGKHLPIEQALGVKWNLQNYMLCFKINRQDFTPTRRNILSIVAFILDPLGFLSPVTLAGKWLLQEMCRSGVGWDDMLSPDKGLQWEAWRQDLVIIENIAIPICIIPPDFGTPRCIELHYFSDASTNGYGQCSCIRATTEEGVHCALLYSKARVGSSRVITIPRLELTAAVLSVRVSTFLRKELTIPIHKEYF